MTGQIVLRSPAAKTGSSPSPAMKTRSPSAPRRQPLISKSSSRTSARLAEVAGGTTAECAAVCCCCPCALINLLVLAVVKLPTSLCRRALKKSHRKDLPSKSKVRFLTQKTLDETQLRIQPSSAELYPETSPSSSTSVISHRELEMGSQLYGTGFWRNPSDRE